MDLVAVDVCCINEMRIHCSSEVSQATTPGTSLKCFLCTGDETAKASGQPGARLVLANNPGMTFLEYMRIHSLLFNVRLQMSIGVRKDSCVGLGLFTMFALAPKNGSTGKLKDKICFCLQEEIL